MFGIYLESLGQAEDLMNKGKYEEALQALNLLEKGIQLTETEKLACMLLNSQIMNKAGFYDKGLMLSKAAFRKSMELSEPLLVVDSTISFLESVTGLGILYDSSKKDQKEFFDMVLRSDAILKTIVKLKKNEKEIRINLLTNLKGIMKHSQIKTIPEKKEDIKTEIMKIPVENVKGVGQKAIELKKAGIKTAVDLAYADVNDLIKIKGIGSSSALKLIETAKELVQK